MSNIKQTNRNFEFKNYRLVILPIISFVLMITKVFNIGIIGDRMSWLIVFAPILIGLSLIVCFVIAAVIICWAIEGINTEKEEDFRDA